MVDGHAGLEAWSDPSPGWSTERSTRCGFCAVGCLFHFAILSELTRGGAAKARVGLIGLAASFLGAAPTLTIAAGVLGFAPVRPRSPLAAIVEAAAIVSTFN